MAQARFPLTTGLVMSRGMYALRVMEQAQLKLR